MPRDVLESKPLMESDDVTRKIRQMIPGIDGAWNVHAMNCGDASRFCQASNLADDEFVMFEKLVVAPAVRQVTLVAAVVVKAAKRRTVNRQVNALIREGRHDLATVPVIERVLVRDDLAS
jgi:hypothetical protein